MGRGPYCTGKVMVQFIDCLCHPALLLLPRRQQLPGDDVVCGAVDLGVQHVETLLLLLRDQCVLCIQQQCRSLA